MLLGSKHCCTHLVSHLFGFCLALLNRSIAVHIYQSLFMNDRYSQLQSTYNDYIFHLAYCKDQNVHTHKHTHTHKRLTKRTDSEILFQTLFDSVRCNVFGAFFVNN